MKTKKFIFIYLILLLLFFLGSFFLLKEKRKQDSLPNIVLKGKRLMTIPIGMNYVEPGFEAIDGTDGNLTTRVMIENTIDPEIPGTYQITYSVTNSKKKTTVEKRFVTFFLTDMPDYKKNYDTIDNKSRAWGTNNKNDHNRAIYKEELQLKKYKSYVQGPDEKVLYLTFDEGTNDTYLEEIVDVLNQNDVKATFFLCKGFIVNHKDLMKKLVNTGHSVGNHTAHHNNMPALATKSNFQKYVNEIRSVEEAFLSATGKEMDKVYREPKGEWSYRSLKIMSDMGYKSYFWGAAYVDFSGTLSKEKALAYMKERYYNGAIYLIHPTNKGNYEAIGEFIQYMKTLGYRFDLVKNIPE